MSYSTDLALGLSKSLANLTPSILKSPPPTPQLLQTDLAHPLPTPPESASQDAIKLRIDSLRAALTKLDPANKITTQQLADLADDEFPPFQGLDSVPLSEQTESVELLLLAQLSISAYGLVIGQLIEEAGKLGEEDDFWAGVEGDRWSTAFFLLQTGPSRFVSLASTTVTRLRAITTSSLHSSTPSRSLLSLNTFRAALPSSVVLASIFPHLSSAPSSLASEVSSHLASTESVFRKTRNILFMSISPLALTRQEVARRRNAIRAAREALAEQIGLLTLAETSGPGLRTVLSSQASSLEDVKKGTWDTLRLLDRVLSANSPTMLPTPPPNTADFAHSLQFLLRRTLLKSHSASFAASFASLQRPSAFTRAWPYLLSIPLTVVIVGRSVYSSRETLRRYATTASETVRGFVIDWVIEPVKKILETVRHSDGGSLALMGKESLKSDVESLQRMVVDFARDQYGMGDEELKALAEKVRVGDLTSVLKVWEADIKSPIRSTISGNLIRTLLIQVQKVKVDVALAMDGIEKMLRSQQLTFGFVGVAPSLIIVLGIGQWLRGLFRRDGGAKNSREVRKRNWATMRHLDALLSPHPSGAATSTTPAQTQGFLLLELTALRTYAHSRYFPSTDTQLLAGFLQDIRALEDSGTEADKDVRRVLVERLWRWSDALGWSRIVEIR